MDRKHSFFVLMAVLTLNFLITGCNSDRNNPVASSSIYSATAVETAKSVSFMIILPESADGKEQPENCSIRAESSAEPAVTFKLVLVNFGNADMPTSTMIKTVPVDTTSGTAIATFTSIPACTCIGDIHIEGGNINSFTDFHGALDLVPGVDNTIRVAPKGSRFQQDFVAHVIEEIVASPILFGKALPNLATQVTKSISNLDRTRETAYADAIALFAKFANVAIEVQTTEPVVADDTLETAPDSNILLVAQNIFSVTSSAQNLLMTLPIFSGQVANFLMTVTNNSGSAQTVVLNPITLLDASIKPDELPRNQSIKKASDQNLIQMYSIKGQLEEILRRNTLNALRQTGGNLRASLRASDHKNEAVGNVYPISMVSNSTGLSYITRNCKLERMTEHCKIFVDQDAFDGLSSVEGIYMVTSDDLTHFAEEFETFIYPLMHNNYGDVYDIDGDGCLSIIISPVYAKIGFAGLFNSIDMTPGATTNSNQRDLIGIWSPSSTKWSGEYWRAATRETIAHEMQHAINYSAKVYPGGVARTGISNYDTLLETIWLDESLSVAAEARYRNIRGNAGRTTFYGGQTVIDSAANDSRFNYWIQNPSTVKIDDFSYSFNAFEHYGQKGLFNFYLYERFGADKIKSLVQTTNTGVPNFENVFGVGNLPNLVTEWQFAVTNEGLRTAGQIDIAAIVSKYRFQTTMNLSTAYQIVQYDALFPGNVSVAPGATAFYVIRQPDSASGSEFKFRIESIQDQAITVNIMRLP